MTPSQDRETLPPVASNHCPPPAALEAFLNDGGGSTGGWVAAHVDGCALCQGRVEALLAASGLAERFAPAAEPPSSLPSASDADPARSTHVLGPGAIPLVPRMQPQFPAVPNYDIAAELGRGGMGVVYRAHHRRLNRTVALKMVLAGGLADPRATQRFLFEAEVLARVQHPQVVQVFEVNIFATPTGVGVPYLAMELLDGGTLGQWMGTATPTPREAAELIAGLARAVHAAHLQGVIHRDLKPGNILRASDGTFKVSDFGLAKATQPGDSNLTATGTVVGTPAYMAPEQAAGARVIGPAADVYALGAMLYELLCGRPPFTGDDPMAVILRVIGEQPTDARSLRPELPRDVAAVAMKCLCKEPHRRYASAEALADDLTRFASGRPTRARPHSTTERLWYWSKRNPAVAGLSALLGLVLLAAFVAVLSLWRKAERNADAMATARDRADRLAGEATVSRDEATKSRDETERLRVAAVRRAAGLAFEHAVERCESGHLDDGLRELVRALELAEQVGDADLARVIRVNVAAWDRELYTAAAEYPDVEPDAKFAFSNTGRFVASRNLRRASLRDADTGRELVRVTGEWTRQNWQWWMRRIPLLGRAFSPYQQIWDAAASDDGRFLAVSTDVGCLLLHDRRLKQTDVIRVRIPGDATPDLWAVRFSPTGTLWVAGANGLLAEYDPRTQEQLRVAAPVPRTSPAFAGPIPGLAPATIQSLAFTPDGKRVFTGDRFARVIEWDASGADLKPAAVRTFDFGWVNAIAVSPDGRWLAATGTASTARIWMLAPLPLPAHTFEVSLQGTYGVSVGFSADSRLAAVSNGDVVRLWDVTGGSPHGQPLRGRGGAFRPGTAELLTVDGERARRLTGAPPPTVAAVPSSGRIRSLDFDPTGRRLLTAGESAVVVNADTGRPVRWVPNRRIVRGAAFDGGTGIFLGQSGGWQFVREDGTGSDRVIDYRNLWFVARDAAPNRAWLAYTDEDRGTRVECWGGDAKTQYAGYTLASGSPQQALPDTGELLVADGRTLNTLDLTTGRPKAALATHDDLRTAAASPDRTRVATGHRDGTVQVWDRATGQPRYPQRPGHKLSLSDVAWSGDGRTVCTASVDGTVQAWDAATGFPLGPRWRVEDAVLRLAVSPTAPRVAFGTASGNTVLRDYPTAGDPAPLADLRARYADLHGNIRPAPDPER